MGCRLNIAESEAIRAMLPDRSDLVVVNGCAVTAEAVRQTGRTVRRLRRERPDDRLVLTGCAAQLEPDRFAAMPEVDAVVGNVGKLDPQSYAPGAPRVRVSGVIDVMRTAPHLTAAFSEQSRAFVEVQTGCDHRCTFCIIPFARGDSRSLPAGAIVDMVARLVDAGHGEIVLTGVDLTSYQDDGLRLGDLIEAILAGVPGLSRLRLSSIDPAEIDDRLFALLAGEARVMPHLHLSAQAGDDMILKRMKRRHRRADMIRLVDRLRATRSALTVGADLIAGFPTENDAMAANSLSLIAEAGIAFAHVFPYSPRPGTPAARMPQVAPGVAKARAAALRAASANVRAAMLDRLVGTRQSMLVERSGLTGHGEGFAAFRLLSPQPAGTILTVVPRRRDGDTLIVEAE
nr:tRNA (N(6)-L-threonylcarbamoyladenosine(37)-C(2))-methylthiotransferase MtaB [Sphingomonas jejuensis]